MGDLLAKTDIENGYEQIPKHPDDFELLDLWHMGSIIIIKHYRLDLAMHAIYLKNLVPLFSGFYTPSFQFLIVDFLFLGPWW